MLRATATLMVLGVLGGFATSAQAQFGGNSFHAQLAQRERQRQAIFAQARAGGMNGAALAQLGRVLQQQRLRDARTHRRFHARQRGVGFGPASFAPVTIARRAPRQIGYSGNPFGGSFRGGNSWYALTQAAAAGRIPWSEVNKRMYGKR